MLTHTKKNKVTRVPTCGIKSCVKKVPFIWSLPNTAKRAQCIGTRGASLWEREGTETKKTKRFELSGSFGFRRSCVEGPVLILPNAWIRPSTNRVPCNWHSSSSRCSMHRARGVWRGSSCSGSTAADPATHSGRTGSPFVQEMLDLLPLEPAQLDTFDDPGW